ncbi:hypothetical protein BGZ65_000089 [Modicella reniformis]|uniref:Calponin-homology (CH) domain-containing protein n=1 Tax=Modicella reniformis TaxID=1440133 RepID=A0A9P6MAF5_9FUNG|nr:hypothetical protein BGZ65_000089 [Modicella reniformis]
MKRKLSKNELNPNNKVYLRRQSRSFTDISNTNTNNNSNSGSGTNHGAAGLQNRTTTTGVILADKQLSSLDHDINTAHIPALILAPFEPSPWLEFGKVIIGSKKTLAMVIQNPTDFTAKLTLDSNCRMEEKGFNISQLDPLHAGATTNSAVEPIVLPPRSKTDITIFWTPLTAGSVRSSVVLKTNNGRFMVNLRGCGEVPIHEYPSLSSSRRKPSTATIQSTKKASITALNPKTSVSKSSTMRPSVTRSDSASIPSAPSGYSTLPYVTTNDMYDDKWIDKQERSFSQWLNHEFNVTVDAFSADDPSSWSYYSHKLEFEHTRAAACKIYQSDMFRIVLRKVGESIGRDRLRLRPDCNLVGDVGARREIMDLLFSFDIRWLVLGLETITGKETAMNPNFDRTIISGFINKAIFHDQQIEAEFEPERVLSNRPKFNQAMNKLILKRLFMLILFLDKAKLARLIPSDPCLFNKDCDNKSCRSLLLLISKNYLLGEGDIIRHLLFMGYSVLHTQSPLDEFDFTVRNLAVDLRDGVRLCRLIDLHCPEHNLCEKMKFPTLSKTHMQQNVNLALNVLVNQGISLDGTRGGVVGPRDVVEGHREKTFGLLWKLVLNWKVSVLLDLNVLEDEIDAIKTEYKRQFGMDQPERVDTVYFTSDQLSGLLRWCQAIGACYNLIIDNFTTSFSDARAFGALLSYYHPTLLDMNDMKDSAQFLKEYKQGLHRPEPQLPEGNDGKGWFIDARYIKDPITQAKEMDRFNYRLLNNKVQALGGVPITLRHTDMSNVGVPDEKAVILFITYLCARLMHLNKDIRAAKIIQRMWRKKHYGRREESRIKATIVIQKHIRKFLARKRMHTLQRQRNDAAVLIQTGCRTYLAQISAILKLEAVINIQTQCRAFLARKRYVELQWAALTIQRYFRGSIIRRWYNAVLEEHRSAQMIQAQSLGYLIRRELTLLRIAAEVVQSRWRANVEARRVREVYLEMISMSIVIQRRWRAIIAGRDVRQAYLQQRQWTVQLQCLIRSRLTRYAYLDIQWAAIVIQQRLRERNETRAVHHRYLMLKRTATFIQERWRAIISRRHVQCQYQMLRTAVIGIQSLVRANMVRRRYNELGAAALIVQHRRRALIEGRIQAYRFLEIRIAARVIQDRWRALQLGRATRVQFQEVRWCIVGVQASIRGYLLRQRLIKVMRENQACIDIQAAWRGYVQRQMFLQLKGAATIIQQRWRAVQQQHHDQHMFQEYRWGATVIQQRWRAVLEGRRVKDEYQTKRTMTLAIQTAWRGHVQRQMFLQFKDAAIIIQQRWRAVQQQRHDQHMFQEYRWGATVIQKRWRRWRRTMEEKAEMERQAAAIMIQAAVRGSLARNRVREYLQDRERVMIRWTELTFMCISAICIQRWWRRCLEQRSAEQREVAAGVIQRWWRAHQEVKQVHELDVLTFRMQTQIRGFLARQRYHCQQRVVLRLQAWWRGHIVRRDSTAKIKAARRRIEHANATAEEHMKLGNHTTMASDILLSSGQLSAVLKACYHLDVVSRLSKNSRLRLVEHNVINIIFQLIKSCNRSQPHMEVLKHGLNIIENLSLDSDTIGSVFWAPEGIEIIVDCVQAYRENEVVFESVVRILLIHLEQDEKRRRVVKAMAPEVKKLKGVLTVMQRKVDRETRSKSLYSAPGKSVSQLIQSVGKLRRIVELLQ